MKYTNKYNMPDTLADAIKADPYRGGGDISTTTLIDAPQIRILKKRHMGELEADVTDMLWALMGTAVHAILERANIKDARKQAFLTVIDTIKQESKVYTGKDKDALNDLAKRLIQLMDAFFPEIKGRYIFEDRLSFHYRGKELTGQFDLYDTIDKILYDYKLCGVFAYIFPESRKKWAAQLNIYAVMLRDKGYEVKGMKIVAIFRDWSKAKMFTNRDYPKQQFMTIDIPVQDDEKMRKYIMKKMDLHFDAEETGIIPECTGEERWASSNTFAVLAKGKVRALRVLDTEGTAQKYILENAHKHKTPLTIEARVGESKRCESYCVVKGFCPQYAKMPKPKVEKPERSEEDENF